MTALYTCDHIRVSTIKCLLGKMLKTLHPWASRTSLLLTSCHESVRQELTLENKRALCRSISETSKEWFVLWLSQSSVREQHEWYCSERQTRSSTESEGNHSPGSVLANRAQSHRTCTQWTGQDAGNGLYHKPQKKESHQSCLGIHLGMAGPQAGGNNVTGCICPRSVLRSSWRSACPWHSSSKNWGSKLQLKWGPGCPGQSDEWSPSGEADRGN